MKRIHWLAYCGLGLTFIGPVGNLQAQAIDPTVCAGQGFPDFCFMTLDNNIPTLQYGTATWGDFDRDGDQDIILTGNQNTFSDPDAATRFYRNSGDIAFIASIDPNGNPIIVYQTVLIELISSAELTRAEQLWQSTVTFADFENDGDLDLLTAGMDSDDIPRTYLYENTNDAIRQFSLVATLPGLSASAAAFADYDNDGDQDFVLTGVDETGTHQARLYENQGGGIIQFEERPANLTGLASGTVTWGDYDNDRDTDLLLTGLTTDQRNLIKLYRNDTGVLVDTGINLGQVLFTSAAFGDYDADGDLDIVVNGGKLSPFVVEGTGAVFRNDEGTFTNANISFRGGYGGKAHWGDYDNDGRMDLLVSGGIRVGATPTARAYRNLGSDLFTLAHDFGGGLLGDMGWADYDNDSDLDMLLLGQLASGSNATHEYRNEVAAFNSRPGAPTGLEATVNGTTVSLSWQAATDLQTPSPGLTYNVRMGTTSGASDIVSPLANPSSGYRYLSARGNVDHNLSWQIKNLPPGTYYWSVQAIDPSYQGSVFAQEGSFTITG